jgi:F-type H+-transporting ATPase subunit gamma
MSRRRELAARRNSLDEIREIMNSMKNLAYMESRKISGFLESQRAVVSSMETAAEDILGFFAYTLSGMDDTDIEVYVLVGSERGFCGDYNRNLLRYFHKLSRHVNDKKLRLISVGQKLHGLLQNDDRVLRQVNGASVAEEVDNVLNHLVGQLVLIRRQWTSMKLSIVYYDDEQQPRHENLLPPFQQFLHRPPAHANAPLLNLQPRQFLRELIHHYLFAAMHAVLYTSLMAENRRRVMHLDGALQHMDEQIDNLHRRDNVLRQEEIVEEIEVILLRSEDAGQTL